MDLEEKKLADFSGEVKNMVEGNAYILDENVIFADNLRFIENDNFIKLNVVLFMICSSGKMQVEVNYKRFSIGCNDMLICSPGFIVGHYMTSPDFDCKVLCLKSTEITQLLLHSERDMWNKHYYIKNHPVIHLEDDAMNLCNKYYELFMLKMSEKSHLYKKKVITLYTQAVLYDVLNLLARMYGDSDEPVPHMSHADILFKRFYDMIVMECSKQRRVSYYADKLCVTPKYLSAVCKSVTGKTASKWISDMVVTEIRNLLLHSNKTIKDISNEFDFVSLSFFGKFVKARLGMSPKEYRRAHSTR